MLSLSQGLLSLALCASAGVIIPLSSTSLLHNVFSPTASALPVLSFALSGVSAALNSCKDKFGNDQVGLLGAPDDFDFYVMSQAW